MKTKTRNQAKRGMRIECSYCGKEHYSKEDTLNHKGMGVFECKDKNMRCQIIQDNLPKLV